MSSSSKPVSRRSRKSIAVVPHHTAESSRTTVGSDKENGKSRRTRSMSLGPGGLDELNAANEKDNTFHFGGAGRRRRESTAPPGPVVAPRSILKAPLPLSPIQAIPNFRKRAAPAEKKTSPATTTVTVPLMTEEEQQKRERERERAEINAARAERRKSLGNRRVSFAPEATLHTWGKNERIENGDNDFTNSTDNSNARTPESQRRGSFASEDEEPSLPSASSSRSRGRGSAVGFAGSDDSIPSSSPFGSSPAQGLRNPTPDPELDGNDDSTELESESEDDNTTTMFGTISAPTEDLTGSSMFDAIAEEEMSEELTTAPNVMKSFFRKPITVIGSNKRNSVGRRTSLRKQAQTEEEEDDGEATMDITKPVGGLLKALEKNQEMQMEMDETMGEATMDMTRPIGGLIQTAPTQQEGDEDDADMSMDMTRPIGGLLKDAQPNYPQLPMDGSDNGEPEDVTMDVTRAIGGILSTVSYPDLPHPEIDEGSNDEEEDDDGDMSMDMTVAIGEIKTDNDPAPGNRRKSLRRSINPSKRRVSTMSTAEDGGDMTMDFTVNIGKILPPASGPNPETPKSAITPGSTRIQVTNDGSPSIMGAPELPVPAEDSNEIPAAFDKSLGGIEIFANAAAARRSASPEKAAPNSPVGKAIEEAGKGSSPAVEEVVTPQPKRRGRPPKSKSVTSTPTAPTSAPEQATDTPPTTGKRRGRPSKSATGTPDQAAPPPPPPPPPPQVEVATPPSEKRRPGRPPKRTKPATPVTATPTPLATQQDVSTPPSSQKRRGRPSKAMLAERAAKAEAERLASLEQKRTPIRAAATAAIEAIRTASSPPPVAATPTPAAPVTPSPLRNVETLTPAKLAPVASTPLRNVLTIESHSLPRSPVGALEEAKAFLASTPKRRLSSFTIPAKSPARPTPRRQSLLNTPVSFTPVKTMDLMAAIAQEKKERKEEIVKEFEERNQGFKRALDETLDLAERIEAMTPRKKRAVEVETPKPATPRMASPGSAVRRKTPQRPSPRHSSPMAVPVGDGSVKIPLADEPSPAPYDGPRLSVEDFFRETEISFLDTLTAKRRQTAAAVVPRTSTGSFTAGDAEPSLADRIVSSAATAQLLNMYVHGCRELKRHVQDYKRNLRVLEQEANEDMPMIMQEFATASPAGQASIKTMMGAMKKFSRGKAKIEWYAWRGNLCEQLRVALEGDLKDLQDDLQKVREWRKETTEPAKQLTETQLKLQDQATRAVELKEKIAQTDPAVLKEARDKLTSLRAKLEESRTRVADLQTQRESNDIMEKEMEENLAKLTEENTELRKVHEANRMMKSDEIKLYKAKIDKYAETTKWRVHKCSAKAVELTFDNFLLLAFPLNGTKPSITFLPDTEPTEAERLLLELLNSIIPDRCSTNPDRRRLTSRISTFWTHVAAPLSANIQKLHRLYRLRTVKSDSHTISTTLKLVIADLNSRVDITFHNQFAPDLSAFETSMSAEFAYKPFDVAPTILSRMKEGRCLKTGEDWLGVVRNIREKVRQFSDVPPAGEREKAKERERVKITDRMEVDAAPGPAVTRSPAPVVRKKKAIPVPIK